MKQIHLKKFTFELKISSLFLDNFFIYLKKKTIPFGVLLVVCLFYLYTLWINRPSYTIFPLEELINLLSGAKGNLALSIQVIARWEYARGVLVFFFLMASFFSFLATVNFLNSSSFIKSLTVKNTRFWEFRTAHIFLSTFMILSVLALLLGPVSFYLVDKSGIVVRFFPFMMAFLILSFISSIFCVVCYELFNSPMLGLIFYIGYFIMGKIVHVLCRIGVIPLEFRNLFYTKSTLNELFSRIIHSTHLDPMHYMPFIAMIGVFILCELIGEKGKP